MELVSFFYLFLVSLVGDETEGGRALMLSSSELYTPATLYCRNCDTFQPCKMSLASSAAARGRSTIAETTVEILTTRSMPLDFDVYLYLLFLFYMILHKTCICLRGHVRSLHGYEACPDDGVSTFDKEKKK